MSDSVTLAGWKKASAHPVVLPSGVTVTIKIPDLPALIESGHIPQNLLDAALSSAAGRTPEKPSPEAVAEQRQFVRKVVAITVVSPKITEEDVDDLPVEDREMLMEMAMRQRDLDAEFNHIGGLHNSEQFRAARGLPERDPLLADL